MAVAVPAFSAGPPRGQFPPLVVGNNFGVSIHRASDPDFDLIAAAGLRIVRLDLTWEAIERVKGVYDWSGYDRTLAALRARGLRALLILDYSNPNYAPRLTIRRGGRDVTTVAPPSNAAARAAFGRFAQAAALHFASDNPLFEIWNEPNQDMFWPPRSDPKQYAELADPTCRAMRDVVPSATIIGPGAAHAPTRRQPQHDFLAALLASGVIGCLDGISVHPYLNISELRDTQRNWELLRDLIARHAGSTGPTPVPINSEWGLTTGGGSIFHRPPDERAQALYVVRMMLLNFASGVPVSIWYDWKDDGADPSDPENRFGLVRQDLSPKPAYRALATAIGALAGSSLGCATVGDDGDAAMVFVRGGDVTLVRWRESGVAPAELTLPSPARIGRSTDLFGQPTGGCSAEQPGIVYSHLEEADPVAVCARVRGGKRP
jgi:hypothetical protein